jgi:hypothetical protein
MPTTTAVAAAFQAPAGIPYNHLNTCILLPMCPPPLLQHRPSSVRPASRPIKAAPSKKNQESGDVQEARDAAAAQRRAAVCWRQAGEAYHNYRVRRGGVTLVHQVLRVVVVL